MAGHPERLAAAGAMGGVNDGSNATVLSSLADQTNGIDDKYYAYLATIGVGTRTARSKADAQGLALQSAREDLNTVSEVNTDDELADLTAAQRAYQASARVITTIDEMLSDLISNFGRVGR